MKTKSSILFLLGIFFLLSQSFAQLTATGITIQNADCFLKNARVRIVVSGGVPPYGINTGPNLNTQWINPDTAIVSGIELFTLATVNTWQYSVSDAAGGSYFGSVFLGVDAVQGPSSGASMHEICNSTTPIDLSSHITAGTPPYIIVNSQLDTFSNPINLNSGIYNVSVFDSLGCPVYTTNITSVIITSWELQVQTLDDTTVDAYEQLCPPFTWIDGNTYTSNNTTATYSIPNSHGCDSVFILNLSFRDSFPDVHVSCDSFTWVDGLTYTQSNNTATYTYSGIGANACDSTLSLDLTILNSTMRIDSIIACDSYRWIDGNTYTASNNSATYALPGGNSQGCDSIVQLKLGILNSAIGTDQIQACDSFIWIDGLTYTSSNNTASYTIVGGAVNGCDSIVTLNLTIPDSIVGVDHVFACDSFTWIDGQTYRASNQAATFSFPNVSNGCDSVVKLDLTIDSLNTALLLTASDEIVSRETQASYQWLACDNGFAPVAGETSRLFKPQKSGYYAVELVKNACIDTSDCLFYVVTGLEKHSEWEGVRIFPNPTSSKFTIDFGSLLAKSRIKIFSATGNLIRSKELSLVETAELELPAPKGLYLLEVSLEDGQSQVFKLVKM